MAIPELENGYRVQDADWNEIVDAVNATAPIKALTQTEYDALSTSEKNNGTVYLIQGGGIAYNGTMYSDMGVVDQLGGATLKYGRIAQNGGTLSITTEYAIVFLALYNGSSSAFAFAAGVMVPFVDEGSTLGSRVVYSVDGTTLTLTNTSSGSAARYLIISF